jgi:hypothetical protein
MAVKTQLIGGNFQDSTGAVLANGYLIMKLSSDEEVNNSLICSGVEIRIQLDANGNVVTSPAQYVWGNDVMFPVNSYYRVTGYTANGQSCYGPNNQQVVGPTFDTGSWTPNSVISWTPPAQSPSVEINGTQLSSATVVDFVNSPTVTFVDTGSGQITATASSVVTVPPGQNVAACPFNINYGNTAHYVPSANSAAQVIPSNQLLCFPANWKVSLYVTAGHGSMAVGQVVVNRTLPGSLVIIDTTPITFAGNPSPTFTAGFYTSDSISLQIDNAHDYWFEIYCPYNGGSNNYYLDAYTQNGANIGGIYGGSLGSGTSNQNTVSPIPAPTGSTGCWLAAWRSA